MAYFWMIVAAIWSEAEIRQQAMNSLGEVAEQLSDEEKKAAAKHWAGKSLSGRWKVQFKMQSLIIERSFVRKGLKRIRKLPPPCLVTGVVGAHLPKSGRYCPVRRKPVVTS